MFPCSIWNPTAPKNDVQSFDTGTVISRKRCLNLFQSRLIRSTQTGEAIPTEDWQQQKSTPRNGPRSPVPSKPSGGIEKPPRIADPHMAHRFAPLRAFCS